MARLEINFEEVPNKFLPVEPGVYEVENTEVERKPNKKGDSFNVVVKHTITTEGEMNGRTITNYLSEKVPTNIKRLALSSGLDPDADGLDTDELVGLICKVTVINEPYTDPQSGETRESSRIRDYIIEGE